MNNTELSTVLAALRHWQETTDLAERNNYPHFDEDVVPMTDSEIDQLCEDLCCAA